jgi:hypothetical protein
LSGVHAAVAEEQPDAEPGEVVDFAPGPVFEGRSEEAQARRVGSA